MRPVTHSGIGARPARGVSLIEVLVAILVVSFGILALSGLLGAATRYGKTSEYRSTATLLAADIADRMRANMPALDPTADLPNPPGAINAYDITEEWHELSGPPAAQPCNPCTPAQMAAMDKAEWQRALYHGLPNGMGYLSYNNTERSADVWVAWLDPAASGDEARFGDGNQRQECPPGFRNQSPQPRCMYFRVGL